MERREGEGGREREGGRSNKLRVLPTSSKSSSFTVIPCDASLRNN